MRNRTNSSRLSMVMAVAMGMLVMTLGAPAYAATEPVVVKNVSVNGGIVQVTVKNVSILPAAPTVAVEAVVGDTAIWSLVPVVLLPGQSTTVSAAFTGAVTSVRTVGIRVGLSDDGCPY
jgi:hypothetical protein